MSDNYDAAIADLQAEIAERMKAVNGLRKLKGLPAIYPDPDSIAAASSGTIRSDQWYTKALSTAVREYLEMRQAANHGPASVDEIYSALVQGGYKFDTKDEATAKPALKQSLTKNTAIFHRLPNGEYGLAEWYPNRKDEEELSPGLIRQRQLARKVGSSRRKTSKSVGVENKKTVQKKTSDQTAPVGKDTLQEAVKSAIKAMDGEFTKQQILDWIVTNKPEKKAEDKRPSIFSMITHLREEMGLETGKPAKGPEPGTYRRTK